MKEMVLSLAPGTTAGLSASSCKALRCPRRESAARLAIQRTGRSRRCSIGREGLHSEDLEELQEEEEVGEWGEEEIGTIRFEVKPSNPRLMEETLRRAACCDVTASVAERGRAVANRI